MASWLQKRRARYRLKRSTAIWYHVDYKAKCLADTARVAELYLDRGERVLGRLWSEGLIDATDVRSSPMASLRDLHLVHPTDYLRSVLDPTRLGRIFGLEAHDIDVDEVLTAQRYAVGGTVAAAEWAIEDASRIAFNLGGGFHHAEPEAGSGFCVYNDIAAAIARLREAEYEEPIAIVDLDFHQGNGNIVAYSEDESVFTYSIHGSTWGHFEAANDHQLLLPAGTGDEEYISALKEGLPRELEEHKPRLVFYIAGNDVLAGDALGTFSLSPEGVFERDRFVLAAAKAVDASVVVTLGGGYSPVAWQATANLFRYALTGSTEVRVSSEEESLRRQFAEIARSLDPHDLQRDSGSWQLTEEGLLDDLQGGRHRARRILDFYSVQGVEMALEEYGLLEKLREKGFTDVQVNIDPEDREHQRLTVHGRKGVGRYHLLVDLVVRRLSRSAPEAMETEDALDLLSVKWLQLQDPTATFTFRRPRLPGQEHPGLGMVQEVMLMLYQACLRLELDGIVWHPSRYHIAALGEKQCFFVDPAVQGRFDALREALASYDLSRASVLLHGDRLKFGDGTPVKWDPADFVAPVSERLVAYFNSDAYKEKRAEASQQVRTLGVVVQDTQPPPPLEVAFQPRPT